MRVPDMSSANTHKPRVSMEGRREMGPAESSSNRTSGAWRLLIWGPLLILAIASGSVSPSAWGGLVALWGWPPLVGGLAAARAGVGCRRHRGGGDRTDRRNAIRIR